MWHLLTDRRANITTMMPHTRSPKKSCVASIYELTEYAVRQYKETEEDDVLLRCDCDDSEDRCAHKQYSDGSKKGD